MDPVTGNDVSGLTITNTDTLESHVSACGGVTFTPVGPPNNYAITAGIGTDCLTLINKNYAASTLNAESPPTGIITLATTGDFLLDTFNEAPTVLLADHEPEVGGAWSRLGGGINYEITIINSINLPSAGTSIYANGAEPPSADYSIRSLIHADTGWSDQTIIRGRFDQAGPSDYQIYLNPPNIIELRKELAGVLTTLDAGTFAMPQLTDPPAEFALEMIGSTINVTIDGTPTLAATDPDITLPGAVGIVGIRAVGQPVHITQISAG